MSDESDDKNLGIENKITRRDFIEFLGVAGTAVTLPSLVPLGSSFDGNTTSINSNSNIETNVTNYQANLIFSIEY
jgi:hypothetical protein